MIVGNEVLLRGELSAADLGAIIREVKSQVSMPVTYADVWEFRLRHSDLQNDVDFVTIHILPYWEDLPLPASIAAAHVADIRDKVARAIPNKEVVIGEVGWPSAGRMREAARPSPSNQASGHQRDASSPRRGRISASMSLRPSTSRGNGRWKARPGAIGGIFRTVRLRRRNSASVASSPIIRIGSPRPPPEFSSQLLAFAGARSSLAAAKPPRRICGSG